MRGINHIVLFVADLPRSIAFYEDVLGFERLPEGFPGGAFLRSPGSANDHDLGLFQARTPASGPTGSVGLYHVAWEVDTLSELVAVRDRLAAAHALTGPVTTGRPKRSTPATRTASSSRCVGWSPTNTSRPHSRRAPR